MAEETVAKVMAALEKFYDEGDQNGQDIYSAFCQEHGATFTSDSDAHEGENKLEWTDIYNKFCKLFEQHLTCKVTRPLTRQCRGL